MSVANKPAAYGLKPVEYLSGVPYSGASRRYYKNQTSNAMFPGDPVIAAGGADVGGYPYADLPTVGNHAWRGVMLGIELMIPDAFATVSYAAAVKGYLRVVDDPHLVYSMQESAATDAVAIQLSDVENGKLDFLAGAGSATSGLSGWTINSTTSTSQSGTGYQVVIKQSDPNPNNVVPGANARWYVLNANYA